MTLEETILQVLSMLAIIIIMRINVILIWKWQDYLHVHQILIKKKTLYNIPLKRKHHHHHHQQQHSYDRM